MRVLIAPDDFTGTLTAAEAAAAMARGWADTNPSAQIRQVPLSDGGPGFVNAMAVARHVPLRALSVTGPRGESVQAHWCSDGETAYVEVAQSCGLALVPPAARDPWHTTSYGVGECLQEAIAYGARRIVVGLGGSGTNDAGAGLLEALGATAFDHAGMPLVGALSAGPAAFADIAGVDLAPAVVALRGIELVIASDVDNPLLGPRGATHGFASQKGAAAGELDALEAAVTGFAALLGRRSDGKDPAVALGAGAAGGIGFALLHLGGHRVPGIDTVLAESGFAPADADLIVTGEGRLDWQTLRGKVITGVARAAMQHGVPVIALCGDVRITPRERMDMGLAAAYSLVELVGEQAALGSPAPALRQLAARAARTWG